MRRATPQLGDAQDDDTRSRTVTGSAGALAVVAAGFAAVAAPAVALVVAGVVAAVLTARWAYRVGDTDPAESRREPRDRRRPGPAD